MEIEEKKHLASSWFRNLRDQFCKEFQTLDGSKFERTKWNHSGSGGGEISLMKGNVFEKVGVNISTVTGDFKDCLLYTSKTPRDRQKSPKPSSA